jgi:hypothetical protein
MKQIPLIDFFELKTLIGQALIVTHIPNFKFITYKSENSLHKIKLSALYQEIVQNIIWLQQVYQLNLDSNFICFDGYIFHCFMIIKGE